MWPTELTLSTSNDSKFIQIFDPLGLNPDAVNPPTSPSQNPYLTALTLGDIEVTPSGDTNEIYVALSANATGSGILTSLVNTNLTLKAVVGNDIYSHTQTINVLNTNYFYVINVTMTKE